MKLHVDWVQQGTYGVHDRVWQGGCWALFKANGDCFLLPTTYGKNDLVKSRLETLADLWNKSQ